jgi:hypothetical protein
MPALFFMLQNGLYSPFSTHFQENRSKKGFQNMSALPVRRMIVKAIQIYHSLADPYFYEPYADPVKFILFPTDKIGYNKKTLCDILWEFFVRFA